MRDEPGRAAVGAIVLGAIASLLFFIAAVSVALWLIVAAWRAIL